MISIGETYDEERREPKTEPWGTPKEQEEDLTSENWVEEIERNYVQNIAKELKTEPQKRKWEDKRSTWMVWWSIKRSRQTSIMRQVCKCLLQATATCISFHVYGETHFPSSETNDTKIANQKEANDWKEAMGEVMQSFVISKLYN